LPGKREHEDFGGLGFLEGSIEECHVEASLLEVTPRHEETMGADGERAR
jgi:hypothetical protein